LVLAVAALLPSTCWTTWAAEPPDRPNIVFILADDLGYGDLGCYGQEQIPTPNLDRLAAQGTRFTQAYAGSTVCAPSRCALMTGLHTGHCRVRGNALVPLQPQDVTVAEVLKGVGYTTALIGKWGLGEPGTPGVPNRQGFDLFFGFLNQHHAHNYWPDYLWRNEEKVPLEGNVIGPNDNVSTGKAQYAPDLFLREALAFVEANKDRPFFLYFANTLPHANNERGRFEGDGMEIPDYGPFADKPWPNPQKGHAAMIARLDQQVGRLMTRLNELGLDEKTLVVFTSDNGTHKEGGADPAFFNSSGPLRGYKRAMYEAGFREPTLVRWTGQVPAGAVSDQVWAFWDILPTFAELAGAEVPSNLDGVSVLKSWLGKGDVEHPPLYWEFHEGGFKQAARLGNWKGVRLQVGSPIELYDLGTDLGEARDVASEYPDVVAKIDTFLKGARTESADFPVRAAARSRR
jgi:arylsulfatase A-like enzyme